MRYIMQMISLKKFHKTYGTDLPKIGSIRDEKDPTFLYKFLDTVGKQDWYVIEGEKRGDNYLFYGYIVGKNKAFGEFTFRELKKKKTVVLATLFTSSPFSQ